MRPRTSCLGLLILGACTVKDPLYCATDKDCWQVPGRTQCDVTGDHDNEHISHT